MVAPTNQTQDDDEYLEPVDLSDPELGLLWDELPLWSAPFGLMLLDRVPMGPALTILDIGAGTGFVSIELAERCGAASKVIAVDPWESAMDRLEWKMTRRHVKNIVLMKQEATALDLPDASVDVIVSNLGINNFEQPAAVLNECCRVAKPGAHVLLTTNLSGHMAEFYQVYRSVLVELGQHDRLDALDAHIQHRGTVQSVTQLLAQSGFSVSEVANDTSRLRFADGSALLRHSFIRLGFVQAWRVVAPADAVRHTFRALELRLNDIAREHGVLTLTVPMACFVAHKDRLR